MAVCYCYLLFILVYVIAVVFDILHFTKYQHWVLVAVSLLRNLKHANIVTLHDIIHTNHSLTIVFEYLVCLSAYSISDVLLTRYVLKQFQWFSSLVQLLTGLCSHVFRN